MKSLIAEFVHLLKPTRPVFGKGKIIQKMICRFNKSATVFAVLLLAIVTVGCSSNRSAVKTDSKENLNSVSQNSDSSDSTNSFETPQSSDLPSSNIGSVSTEGWEKENEPSGEIPFDKTDKNTSASVSDSVSEDNSSAGSSVIQSDNRYAIVADNDVFG